MLRFGQLPTHSITYNLSNCTSSNTTTSIIDGNTYTTVIMADNGYEISDLIIKINGVEMSSDEYWVKTQLNLGTLTIPNVSGNIEIEVMVSERITMDFNYEDNGDGTYTLTEWLGTYNGEPSTLCYIPDDSRFIL